MAASGAAAFSYEELLADDALYLPSKFVAADGRDARRTLLGDGVVRDEKVCTHRTRWVRQDLEMPRDGVEAGSNCWTANI